MSLPTTPETLERYLDERGLTERAKHLNPNSPILSRAVPAYIKVNPEGTGEHRFPIEPEPILEPTIITLTYLGEILSVNHLYPTNQKTGRRFTSQKGIAFKTRAHRVFTQQLQRAGYTKPDGETFWAVTIMLFTDCFYKNGNVRKMDASNKIKVLEDAVAEALGIDDRFFWYAGIEKRHSTDNPRAVIQLEQMTRDEVLD